MPATTKRTPLSTALTAKGAVAILEPEAAPFAWNGKTYDIKPMPDSLLMRLADETTAVVEILNSLGNANFSSLSAREIAPILPQIVRLLIPNATRIIAVCLGIDEQTVADEMRLAKKLEALTLIVQAEDFALLLKNFGALTATFAPAETSSTKGNSTTKRETTETSTEAPSTSS